MQAIFFQDNSLTLTERPVPEPLPSQALLRPLLAGICHTDIELLRGYYGFAGVAGHEFVAVVERATHRPELEGRRVVADINIGCGRCSWCKAGDRRHCLARRTIGIHEWDGAFARYLKAPLENLHLVPDELADEQAVFAEPLAAALEISQQVHLTYGKRMVVLGDGKLGLLIALALRHYNPGLLLVGRHPAKLAIAQGQGVRVHALEPGADLAGLPAALGRFDVVVEATGRAEGLDLALELAVPEGLVVAKTTRRDPASLNLAKLVVDEITILGSRCGNLALALEFLQNNWLAVRPLIEAVYPFAEYEDAFAHAMRPGALKVLLGFGQS